nr:outer membrane protein assembly factor BamA [Tranquillimonas alkanivorans]
MAAPLAVVPTLTQAQAFSFTDVRIEGAERVSPGTILSYAEIPRGTAVDAAQLNDAYQRIVQSGLFQTVELVPQGNTLVIRVEEWPTVNRIAFEGNNRLDDEELAALVQTTPRRVYDPGQAEEDARRIVELYEQRGRLAATVSPKIIERADNRVDLVFEIAEGGVVEIERISFVGNRDFSDRRLRRVLATKQAGLLRQVIQRDTFVGDRIAFDQQLLQDFYASRGYVDFQVLDVSSEFSRERNAFFLTFNIREGQSFDFGNVSVSSDIPGVDASAYRRAVASDPGDTYSPTRVDTDVARLERLAIQRGETFVRADPVITRNAREGTLDVNYVLRRGERIFVERIDIEGNQTTLDRVIRRQFRTVEGDPFNPRQIRQAAERIRALGYFETAEVETRQGTAPDQVIVDVDVQEAPTGSLSFGASYSADSGPGLNVSFAERNFLGRGQTLRFEVTTGADSASSAITFIEPYFLGRDLAARLDVFYRIAEQDNTQYNTQVAGFSPALAFPVGENSRLQLRYRLSEERLYGVDGFDPAAPAEQDYSSAILEEEEGSQIVSSIGYTYSYDTRRSGLNPNGGILLEFGQDFAGVGGDAQYVRTEASATVQREVWNGDVLLRGVVEGGALNMISDDSQVTDRFFLSTNQLRGFAPKGIGPRDTAVPNEDALGGNYFAVARLEAEFPIGLPEEYGISGGVFLDAGSVWGLDNVDGGESTTDGIDIVDDDFALRSSVGFSIFWDTPIGPLRLNWAEALQQEDYDETQVFNLTIATQF